MIPAVTTSIMRCSITSFCGCALGWFGVLTESVWWANGHSDSHHPQQLRPTYSEALDRLRIFINGANDTLSRAFDVPVAMFSMSVMS